MERARASEREREKERGRENGEKDILYLTEERFPLERDTGIARSARTRFASDPDWPKELLGEEPSQKKRCGRRMDVEEASTTFTIIKKYKISFTSTSNSCPH